MNSKYKIEEKSRQGGMVCVFKIKIKILCIKMI
jgi:hypothetical protein